MAVLEVDCYEVGWKCRVLARGQKQVVINDDFRRESQEGIDLKEGARHELGVREHKERGVEGLGTLKSSPQC